MPRTATVPMRCSRLVLLAAALGTLASCGMFDNSKQYPCPTVGVPRESAALTLFREGDGRDLTDVIFAGGIKNTKLECSYSSNGPTMTLGVIIGGELGPAARTRTATVPYFIAIVDPDRNILTKQVFNVTLSFPPNVSQANIYDETEEKIPLPKNVSAERYGIAVGMQLTPDQLEYNRQRILH
jgi:hypothetical protein